MTAQLQEPRADGPGRRPLPRALTPFRAPPGDEGKKVTQDFQKAELEKSIAYLRKEIGLGAKA